MNIKKSINRIWGAVCLNSSESLLKLLASLLVLTPITCLAVDYEVSNQAEFDVIKNAELNPGDAILLKRGEEFIGMLSPTGIGTEAEPIRIGSYGEGDRPIIHGLPTWDGSGNLVNNAAVLLEGHIAYWEIEGLELTNNHVDVDDDDELYGILVYIDGPDDTIYQHIHIHDNYIHDVHGMVGGKERGGIHVYLDSGLTSSWVDDLQITNNRIEDVGGVGIATASSNANVDLLPDGGLFTENLWTRVYIGSNYLNRIGRNAIIIRVCIYGVVEYNTLGNSSQAEKGHSVFCFDTHSVTIQYNEAYGNVATDSDGEESDRGGFDADYNCVDTLIQYNYSHDNEWFCGIMKKPNRNVVIRYNVSQNERQGFYFYGFNNYLECESVHIYNNTHFASAGTQNEVFVLGRTPLNTILENNIFYFEDANDAGYGVGEDGINTTYKNNLYYNLPPHSLDTNPIIGDPLFTKPGIAGTDIDLTTLGALRGYQLLSGSPAIDAASIISGAANADIVGGAIDDGAPDIGAFEFQGPLSRVTFDFLGGSVWDNGIDDGGQIGSAQIKTNPLTGEHIRLTTIDVIGQNGIRTSDGESHTLNVLDSANYLGVNDDSGNPGGYNSEFRDFNPNEGWVFSFDTDIYLENIELGSQNDDAELTLSSDLFDDIILADGQPDDVHDLGYQFVPAGSELTLMMTTPTNGTDIGIGVRSITVSAVPFLLEGVTVLQAESYDDASGATQHLASDEGEIVAFNGVGAETSYDVYVRDAGTYLIGFRVASNEGDINLDVLQNENWVAGLQRVISDDGSWTSIYKEITLEAGRSTFHIVSEGGYFLLDWLEFKHIPSFTSGTDVIGNTQNIALNQSYSASNVYQNNSNYLPDEAFDGIIGENSSRWATDTLQAWLEVDFGKTILMSGTRFYEYEDRIEAYEIQIYNGEWITVFTGGNPDDEQTDWFPAVSGSKLRLVITEANMNPSIYEFEVLSKSLEASIAIDNGVIALEWENIPGLSYSLQSSTDLTGDSFITIESGIPSLEESSLIKIPISDEKVKFFRVEAE